MTEASGEFAPRTPVDWREKSNWRLFAKDDDLLAGLTDMPEDDIREIAAYVGVTPKIAQGVVWLTEIRCKEVWRDA